MKFLTGLNITKLSEELLFSK